MVKAHKVKESHVLVIDDNVDILNMLQVILQHKGYQASILDNTNGLIDEIISLQPDVILMDKLLSGSDGCEFCKLLKTYQQFVHIPVIMISAHPQAKKECLEAGADFFIEKPFEMNHLLKTITKALHKIKK